MSPDITNELFYLAADLINKSCRNVFLTGKAGTGKTTFLKYIRENCVKQTAVVAPTGVAAINASGVTIHSFFQLPIGLFLPTSEEITDDRIDVFNRHSLVGRQRITSEKIKIFQKLDLLIIDEISMVRCDVLDAIDTVLRHTRRRPHEPFGGVQVLLIGDMFQLSPVVKDQEWRLLSQFYSSPYFFDSKVLADLPPLYIEFNKIYRQRDETFIKVLNQVRNNVLDKDGLEILEKRYHPDFRRTPGDGFIILTTHNEKVKEVNNRELGSMNEASVSYRAEINGDFPENNYPGEQELVLKKGAQVMFIRNDSDREKKYYNGKIGTVTRLEEDKVFVLCNGEDDEIEVGREKWENIRYALNDKRQVEPEVLGSFVQYPLRLAWAISIHKSQGLTFEKAIIDAGNAFAAGQVYVALSRCTSLEGLILQSRINASSLSVDKRLLRFSERMASEDQLKKELADSGRDYFFRLILVTFDFGSELADARELLQYVAKHPTSFSDPSIPWAEKFVNKLDKLEETAARFRVWLKQQFSDQSLSEENNSWQQRTVNASGYFDKEIIEIIRMIRETEVLTDSRLHAGSFNELGRNLFSVLAEKQYLIQGFSGKMDTLAWLKRKKDFRLPELKLNIYAGGQEKTASPHPGLFQQLRRLRDSICAKTNKPIYMVASTRSIEEMVQFLPFTASDLERISGFGKARVASFGEEFLDIIRKYCDENGLASQMEKLEITEKTPARKKKERKKEEKEQREQKPQKPDTRSVTLGLFQSGMNIEAIATERNLGIGTIEGHLAHYVENGEIDIATIVSSDKLSLIKSAIETYDGDKLSPLKEFLGDTISYGEIRLVLAWKSYKKNHSKQVE